MQKKDFKMTVIPIALKRGMLCSLGVMLLCMTCGSALPLTIVQAAANPFRHFRVPTNTAVTTYHNDNLRTGQNFHETILNTNNVNTAQFGKRVSYPVDGQVYAQPLFMPNVIVNGSSYNVVYVATENDSVYAFDADQTSVTVPLWHTSFINPPAVTTVPASEVYGKYPGFDIEPQVGITGTPVIDSNTGTLYVVALTKENGTYVQRLHVLDIQTGKDKPGSPLQIQASVPGTGYDNVNGVISFNAKTGNQRSALLLSNGNVYVSWAAYGDTDPYHGWVIGYHYDGQTLQQLQAAVYNDTPDGQEGGIWMSGAGPSVDENGNIYVVTGNGSFDLNTHIPDLGDSFVKLSTANGLSVADYFTPFDQLCMDGRDFDLGSGGALLLPDQPGPYPHLLVGIGKGERIYVINRDDMGGYTSDPQLQCGGAEEHRTDIDKVVQEFVPPGGDDVFGISAYWGGTASSGQFIYSGGFGAPLRAFSLTNGTLLPTTVNTPETFGFSGTIPSVSSNGNASGTGIVWVIGPASCNGPGCIPSGPATLRAYDATNISQELYNSAQNPARDQLDSYMKFSLPTVANGEVFVGTQTSLSIFGLLNTSSQGTITVDDSVQGTGLDQFNYVGNWGHCINCNFANEGMYDASNSWDDTANDYVTFTFTGTSVSFYGVERPFHGIGMLSIDGGSEVPIDFYAAENLGDQLLWKSPTLSSGTHTLKLRVTGTKDALSSGYYATVDRVDITQ